MSADHFSDDDDDDMALAAAADVLEKSIADPGVQTLENSNKITKEETGDTDQQTCQSQFSIQFLKGDLFSCPKTDSLAHCVSKDLRMGKGIAVLFKQKFGGVSELKAQACRIGEVGILKREGRNIYYLITKAKYSDKPTYQSLESTLRSMKNHCVKCGVKRLSMPRIGCGLDKLVWSSVENILRKVFGDTDITITVYSI